MSTIKVIADLLINGKCVLIPSECGWGVACSAKSSQAISEIIGISSDIRKGEELILIETSNSLYDYMADVPEMALTLLEISDKPLMLTIECWNATLPPKEVFTSGISFRIDDSQFIKNLLRSTKSDLIFIPLFTNDLDNISKSLQDKLVASSENTISVTSKIVKPGIIKFFANGAFKILRE